MNNQEITQANNLRCPSCQLSHIKRNGHTYYGKQNYQCKLCDRQFVIRNETVSQQKQELIKVYWLNASLCAASAEFSRFL
jgi:transposase-like protein